ncbi:hypothetical protein [Staphylococcus shinii]|uniref:hypothetical protein n=1 Tax=Staphylococcus shinii TaxID=2912228 RepID=UPI003EEF5938
MENVLNISNFEDGNRIKQGDLSEIRYVLLDTNHDDLNLTGKGAVVYLINRQSEVIYQKALTVVKHDENPMVTLTIDDVIPAGTYTLEIVVDNKYIFPSDTKEKIEVVDSVLGKAFKKVSENNLYGEIIDYGLSNGKFDTLKGEKGDSITITHKYIDEDGNTFVQFSDGTNIIVHKGQQGESLQIQSKKVNEDGDIDLVFSDGTKLNIQKPEVSDEKILDVMKQDFLKGRGQIKVHKIKVVDEEESYGKVTWGIYYDAKREGYDDFPDEELVKEFIDKTMEDNGGFDGNAGLYFSPKKFFEYLKEIQYGDFVIYEFDVYVKENGEFRYLGSNLEVPIWFEDNEREVYYAFNGHPIEEFAFTYNTEEKGKSNNV